MSISRPRSFDRRPVPSRGSAKRAYVGRPRLVNGLATLLLAIAVAGAGAAGPVRAAEPLSILMLGDSLTAGYGVDAEDTLPAQLEAELRGRGHDVKVVNGGVSGDTSAGGRARLAWALGDRPDAVIVALGSNDALRGLPPRATRENLDAILARLSSEGIPALLVGMKAPRNMGADYVEEFDAVFPALARKHAVPFYPFILEGVALEEELNQDDGMHPNARGVARIVAGLLPLVEALIARAKGGGAAAAP